MALFGFIDNGLYTFFNSPILGEVYFSKKTRIKLIKNIFFVI